MLAAEQAVQQAKDARRARLAEFDQERERSRRKNSGTSSADERRLDATRREVEREANEHVAAAERALAEARTRDAWAVVAGANIPMRPLTAFLESAKKAHADLAELAPDRDPVLASIRRERHEYTVANSARPIPEDPRLRDIDARRLAREHELAAQAEPMRELVREIEAAIAGEAGRLYLAARRVPLPSSSITDALNCLQTNVDIRDALNRIVGSVVVRDGESNDLLVTLRRFVRGIEEMATPAGSDN